MTAQAEIMETRVEADLNVSMAAMATDAGVHTPSVHIIVMARDAVDRTMPVMGEAERQRNFPTDQWLAHGDGGSTTRQRPHGHAHHQDSGGDQA